MLAILARLWLFQSSHNSAKRSIKSPLPWQGKQIVYGSLGVIITSRAVTGWLSEPTLSHSCPVQWQPVTVMYILDCILAYAELLYKPRWNTICFLGKGHYLTNNNDTTFFLWDRNKLLFCISKTWTEKQISCYFVSLDFYFCLESFIFSLHVYTW